MSIFNLATFCKDKFICQILTPKVCGIGNFPCHKISVVIKDYEILAGKTFATHIPYFFQKFAASNFPAPSVDNNQITSFILARGFRKLSNFNLHF